ncbi:hypothetical protein NPIL_52681 [Nephila pilipes]|uniref:Uncharacterized protein n=1 Tax=Nephila pilipes TaxID=299642 RepID=A0A8X6NYJ2_NEPPI|nr:hypothetical protein NPIL_52681 [Nephila pilipes]
MNSEQKRTNTTPLNRTLARTPHAFILLYPFAKTYAMYLWPFVAAPYKTATCLPCAATPAACASTCRERVLSVTLPCTAMLAPSSQAERTAKRTA